MEHILVAIILYVKKLGNFSIEWTVTNKGS